MREIFSVYAPADPNNPPGNIRPGSGIVGTPEEDGRVCVDYEGDLYSGQATWEHCVARAAGRHYPPRYPTIARAWVDRIDLVEVGYFDWHSQRVTITNPEHLAPWRSQLPREMEDAKLAEAEGKEE